MTLHKRTHNNFTLALCSLLCCAFLFSVACTDWGTTPAVAVPAASAAPTEAPTATAFVPTPSPTATALPTATPAPTPFSMIWLSDTQRMTSYVNLRNIYFTMMQYIGAYERDWNTTAVLHTGDVVDYGPKRSNWDAAIQGFDLLDPKVPLYSIAGNHDRDNDRSYTTYTSLDFVHRLPSEQLFRNGEAFYAYFSAGGTDFVVAGISFLIIKKEGAGEFLRAAFDAKPDAVGILLTHNYLNLNGSSSYDAQLLIEQVVQPCKNVRLVLCGHVQGADRRQDAYDDDGDGTPERTVNVLRFNYEDMKINAKQGYYRILWFDPADRSIAVDVYSPWTQDGNFEEDETRNRFTLTDAF